MSIRSLQLEDRTVALELDVKDIPPVARTRSNALVTAQVTVSTMVNRKGTSPPAELTVVLRNNAWEGNFQLAEPVPSRAEVTVSAQTPTGQYSASVRNLSASYLTRTYVLWFLAIALVVVLVAWLHAQELIPRNLAALYPLLLLGLMRADSILGLVDSLSPWEDLRAWVQRHVVQQCWLALGFLVGTASTVWYVARSIAEVKNDTATAIPVDERTLEPGAEAWLWAPVDVDLDGEQNHLGPKTIWPTLRGATIQCPDAQRASDLERPAQVGTWSKKLSNKKRATCLSDCGIAAETCGTLTHSPVDGVEYEVQLPWVPALQEKASVQGDPLAHALELLVKGGKTIIFPPLPKAEGATWTNGEGASQAGAVVRIGLSRKRLRQGGPIDTPTGGAWTLTVNGYDKAVFDMATSGPKAAIVLMQSRDDPANDRVFLLNVDKQDPVRFDESDLPPRGNTATLVGLEKGQRVHLTSGASTAACALGPDLEVTKVRVHGGRPGDFLLSDLEEDAFMLKIPKPREDGVEVWSCRGPFESDSELISGLRRPIQLLDASRGYCVDFTTTSRFSKTKGNVPSWGTRCSR